MSSQCNQSHTYFTTCPLNNFIVTCIWYGQCWNNKSLCWSNFIMWAGDRKQWIYNWWPYPSTKRSKHSNCTVNPSKYGKENQGMHFHYHHQAYLIHCFIITNVIQCRIWVIHRYFINQVRSAWPRQNLTWLTRMTWPGFNPGITSQPAWLLDMFAQNTCSQMQAQTKH